jgi:hypothetical protein
LIQIPKRIILSNGLVTKLEKAAGSSRFDINDTTVNDTIPVSKNSINSDFILFSYYFMSRCSRKLYDKMLYDVSIGVLDLGIGREC